MENISNFWNMTNEARQKTLAQKKDLTYFKVEGRLNIQTSETGGFSLSIAMHVWAIDKSEAAQKATEEAAHFYQRAYPDYTLKVSFLNDGPIVT